MASPEPEPAAIAVPILFRPAKRRKIFRHRSEDAATADDQSTPTPEGPLPATTTTDPDDDAEQEAHTLRLRQAARKRRPGGGVAFRAGGPSSSGVEESSKSNTERGMVLHSNGDAKDDEDSDEDSLILGGINRRFAPQTGLVGELVNRHMEEYVESELRKRVVAAANADVEATQQQQYGTSTTGMAMTAPLPPQAESQRVMQGKLLEIDLGDEARARNIEMTERARRRLQGLGADAEETVSRPTKIRLGPDGKPWRGKKRRGSEDIKRDQLVEEFLHENSLGVYDIQPEQRAPSLGVGDDDMAADERIAEEFRREFMDAVSRGRRKKAAPAPAKPGARKEEEVLKGPKLGGSRNARAAMRDLLLKEQEMKKQRR
ncbi:hepatocellular carcinoma-associated antigen 59-domain-containing protein [Podospora conica]|nr:hepatocellular carcinoma-associated antigen 59-domain-containing protein [Schizothecium conicum]